MVKHTKNHVGIRFDDGILIKWLDEGIESAEFESVSQGIRKCVRIAKRVYETGTPEELMRFVMGRKG